MPTQARCSHSELCLDGSTFISQTAYERPSAKDRRDAVSRNGHPGADDLILASRIDEAGTFPGPLILPGDNLADDEDPEREPQSFSEWLNFEDRVPVTPARKTIYIAGSPEIHDEMAPMRSWADQKEPQSPEETAHIEPPRMDDIVEYLSAFYYGMDVKLFKPKFYWRAWEYTGGDGTQKSKSSRQSSSTQRPKYDGTPIEGDHNRRYVGLRTPKGEVFRIRSRPSPDGASHMQVNLDDVLDALHTVLPKDAFAIMMLLDQDMFETDGEVCTGGRAYGASRIAVINRFREHHLNANPDPIHSWPASHCAKFASSLCPKPRGKRQKGNNGSQLDGVLSKAVGVVTRTPPHPSKEALTVQWLSRVVQTMSHELGHCLGLDHCVYFACVMQGCDSNAEAQRQPPYLCPVCLQKVAWTIGACVVKGWEGTATSNEKRKLYVTERYQALRNVCAKFGDRNTSTMFLAFATWIDGLLEPRNVIEVED